MATLDPDETHLLRYIAPYGTKTRRRYLAILLDWLAFCVGARKHILEADRTLIEQWAAAAGKTRSQSTVAGMLVPVCGFYRWAHQEGLIPTDPGAYVRRPRRARRSNLRWLSQDQAGALLSEACKIGPPHDLLIHLLLLNGLRLGETLAARVEHLGNVDGHTTLLLPSRKLDVMDRVSLPAATATLLPASIAGRDKGILLRTDGKALTPAAVYRQFDQLSAILQLNYRLRPHQLRATFVTLSLDAGVPARDVMASTGHASVEMVTYYDRGHASVRRNASHRLADHLSQGGGGA